MPEKELPHNVDLVFKEPQSADMPPSSEAQNSGPRKYAEVGPSSLYGRRGDNITFHAQGAHARGYWQRLWSWVWKDLGRAILGIIGVFFSREK